MKNLLSLLLFLPLWAYGQTGPRAKVPEYIRQKIQTQLQDMVLEYKQGTHPNIRPEEYMTREGNTTAYREAKGFFLRDSVESTSSYQLIFDSIEPWISFGNYIESNYYLVTKRGHRFTNFRDTYQGKDYTKVLAWQDTVNLELSNYYLADEYYLVYCDSTDLPVVPISGNFFLANFSSRWIDLSDPAPYLVYARTTQYHKKRTNQALTTLVPLRFTDTHYEFVLENTVFDHGLVVKLRHQLPHDMELTYYTNNKKVTGGNGNDFYEVTLPRPSDYFQGYGRIKPRIRKLSKEEGEQIRNTPAIFQAAWVFYPYWEDPVSEE